MMETFSVKGIKERMEKKVKMKRELEKFQIKNRLRINKSKS